jgi:hypothetical protein
MSENKLKTIFEMLFGWDKVFFVVQFWVDNIGYWTLVCLYLHCSINQAKGIVVDFVAALFDIFFTV